MTNQSSHFYALILAGGTGTRLWPRSRRERPKQLLDLVSERTMLQETYDRIRPLLPAERILVATNEGFVQALHAQLPDLPAENILPEPEGKNTAPSIGLGALTIARRDPDALMFSLHSDHYVQHPEGFREGMLAAAEIASRNYLVTLGVHPSYPETGYGYIQRGDLLDRLRGLPVYRVQRFTEKPDEATAAQFVASGEYYWNTGMFTWRVSVILEEYARYLPDLTAQLNEIAPLIGTPRERSAFARVWPHVPVVTVDTGIAEKTARITVIPIDVGWSDVGSWATLLDLLPSDGNQNVVFGEHIGVDTSASLIYSSNRLIATVGLTDMIVVDTGDAILVCPKNRAQEVKHIVEQLKRNKKEKYL